MPGHATPLHCPSAPSDAPDAQVLGVVVRGAEGPRVAYVAAAVPVTADILASTAPAAPGEVLRIAARCQAERCAHFDGAACRLAARVVATLAAVAPAPPPCAIRRTCRWFHQEGRDACARCPQVVTLDDRADARIRQLAMPPSVPDRNQTERPST